jgi:hypothetical protein
MRRTLLLAGVVVLALAAVGLTRRDALFPGSPTPHTATAEPEQLLVIPDGRDSFGEVWLSKDFAWTFPVVNRGDQPVAVRDAIGSCTCLSVSPRRFTLQPGQTQVITAHIDLTMKHRQDGPSGFVITYEVADDAGQSKLGGKWVVTGNVRTLVMLDKPLDFGRRSVLAQPLKPVSVVARFGTKVDSVTAQSASPELRAEITPRGPDGRYLLTLTPTGRFPVGPLNTAVVLKIKPASGDERSERLSVAGQIIPDVEASPPSYPGGGQLIGTALEFDVSVSSGSGQPFAVVGVKTVGDGLSVAGSAGRYVVRQACRAAGPHTGRIDFEVTGIDGRYVTSVTVDYTGLQP